MGKLPKDNTIRYPYFFSDGSRGGVARAEVEFAAN
jgi:hypothetical protein